MSFGAAEICSRQLVIDWQHLTRQFPRSIAAKFAEHPATGAKAAAFTK
jgi:hypothetical protein